MDLDSLRAGKPDLVEDHDGRVSVLAPAFNWRKVGHLGGRARSRFDHAAHPPAFGLGHTCTPHSLNHWAIAVIWIVAKMILRV